MTTNKHVKKEEASKLALKVEHNDKTNDSSLIPGSTCWKESTPINCPLTCPGAPWHTCAHTHLHTK